MDLFGCRQAVHCRQLMLPFALHDFTDEVLKRLREGRVDEAKELWGSAVLILHKPFRYMPNIFHQMPRVPPGFDTLREMPCTYEWCHRCRAELGGSDFPWIGVWTRRANIVDGRTDPWTAHFHLLRDDQRMDLATVLSFASKFTARAMSPAFMEKLLQRTDNWPWPTGCASRADVLDCWRTVCFGSEVWRGLPRRAPSREVALDDPRARAQRTLSFWLMDNESCDVSAPLLQACRLCGTPSTRVCRKCCKSCCLECSSHPEADMCCDHVIYFQGVRQWTDSATASLDDFLLHTPHHQSRLRLRG